MIEIALSFGIRKTFRFADLVLNFSMNIAAPA
jgi:hypothetical protein